MHTTIERMSGGGLMMPIAEVCVATGAALTGASPPVLSSEAEAGADDGTSAMSDIAWCSQAPHAGAVGPEGRWGWRRRTACLVERTFVRHIPLRSRLLRLACTAPVHRRTARAGPEPPAAARVGACDADMSADAAPNTVFVRNLPFNVSDEQVRCCALRDRPRAANAAPLRPTCSQLRAQFEDAGPVRKCFIVKDKGEQPPAGRAPALRSPSHARCLQGTTAMAQSAAASVSCSCTCRGALGAPHTAEHCSLRRGCAVRFRKTRSAPCS